MERKRILCPERLRRVPRTFSWIDHRLVRNRHISRCSHEALALYLFLVTVGDAEGLSYYSDKTVGRLLKMDAYTLASARRELCSAGLIAYRHRLYQVLSLDDPITGLPVLSRPVPRRGSGEAVSIGEVLRPAMGGAV
ncbi:hypothetical protein ACFLQR_03930 [Verrucomicrobiota bacterium]